LDHAPAVALRSEFYTFWFEPFRQPFQAFVGFWPNPLPLERGVGLWNEGAYAQGEAQPRGLFFEVQQQIGGGLDVVVLLRGKSHHSVELEAFQSSFFGIPGGGADFLTAEFLIHDASHSITSAFDGDRDRLTTSATQGFR
jgi:hypothetical protein